MQYIHYEYRGAPRSIEHILVNQTIEFDLELAVNTCDIIAIEVSTPLVAT